jgi:hypothetical protein
MATGALPRRARSARRRQRLLAGLALGLLTLTAELGGRSLTHRLDVGRHVGRVSYDHASYYPFLLAGVKIAIALTAARVVWRFARAHAAARAAHRVAAAFGARRPRRRLPQVRIELSPRLWLLSFVGTSSIYLVQADGERAAAGRLTTVFGPWLHSSALPVFAVLSVAVAVLYRGVESWLADAESLAADAVALARQLTAAPAPPQVRRPRPSSSHTPRSRFGLEFESRPPPLPA